MVNGVLYFTVPDHVWAVDARTGRELWHYQWQTTGGNHLGNRGVAIYEDWLYFETPDCYLISLNVKDGKRALAQADLRHRSLLLRVGRADDHQGSPDRRRQRRRLRHSRLHPVASSGERRDAVALLHRAAEEGRSRHRRLAERGDGEARRRHDLAAGHLRSGAQLRLRHDRQPAAGHRAQEPRRATTCSPARSSRSTPTPARWSGTSSRRRTTRTTGTRRRPRC